MSTQISLTTLRTLLKEQNLDALWISDPTNVRALTGFSDGKDGKVLVTQDEAWLYTDARYTVQAQKESCLPQFIALPPETYQHAAEIVKGKRVGVESHHLTVHMLQVLQDFWQAELIDTYQLIEELRRCKSESELTAIREAQALTDRVFNEVRPLIQAGVRELDIAIEIETRFRRAGATTAFSVIVASGPRGAMPHGIASERVIQDNELVTVDMGACLGGYNSDMTRTVAVGTPSSELIRLYNAVLEAEEAAVRAVKAGLKACDLDAVARDTLRKHDLAEAFAHSLGHGVGLEVHEGPRLSHNNSEVLKAGMVITIEPGVYIPELGGVRIEDLVLVTEDGCEVISSCEKERF